jgi:uncharacterized protein (TIGR02246 family)
LTDPYLIIASARSGFDQAFITSIDRSCHLVIKMDNQEPEVKSIRELEHKAREAAKAKDLDRYVSFYADDAVLLWPGASMVTGRAAIREFMRVFFSMPDFSLSFETAHVEVSRAGDFAYTCGTNKVTLVNPNGEKMKDSGKYLTVYRKQSDGTWKVVADTGNSDLPAPVPT